VIQAAANRWCRGAAGNGPARLACVAAAMALAMEVSAPHEAAAQAEPLLHPAVFSFYHQDSPLQDTSFLNEPYRGDLTDMIKRRVVRVLVTYDRANFFIEDGSPRGFEYELVQQYRRHLKTRVKPRSWPVNFVFIPVRFDQLLPALENGWGDIAAAGLTETPARARRVAFTEPYIHDVDELVVTSGVAKDLTKLDDLAGRQVYVNGSSSYAEHLRVLSQQFVSRGLPPIEIVPAHNSFSEADLLELLQMGAIDITIMHGHLARFWANVYPGLRVHEDLAIHRGGQIGWAVRKDSPELLESLNRGLRTNRQGTLIGNVLLQRYFRETRRVDDPLGFPGSDRLADLKGRFQKDARTYGFDWHFLAAVAYQESKLEHDRKSPAGAMGIMQVRPSTAAAEPVSIPDISGVEANIHAGTKYLAHLRDDHFPDLKNRPQEQLDFVVAAYNAGPTKIRRLRRQAAEMGLNDNQWFAGVDALARAKIGRETVDYVTKVNKYFVAYRLAPEMSVTRAIALLKAPPPPPPPALPPSRPSFEVRKLRVNFE
jgi:membrane-bound lytic murein transglycosylase MltF